MRKDDDDDNNVVRLKQPRSAKLWEQIREQWEREDALLTTLVTTLKQHQLNSARDYQTWASHAQVSGVVQRLAHSMDIICNSVKRPTDTTVEQLRAAGVDPFAILHRFWDSKHEHFARQRSEEPFNAENAAHLENLAQAWEVADMVFTVICDVWRPGMSADEWFVTVVEQLEGRYRDKIIVIPQREPRDGKGDDDD